MARIDTFTFRVSKNEKLMLASLAASLQRTQSDAIRLLIREAVNQLETPEIKRQSSNTTGLLNADAN